MALVLAPQIYRMVAAALHDAWSQPGRSPEVQDAPRGVNEIRGVRGEGACDKYSE
jgi:hypothetical protein